MHLHVFNYDCPQVSGEAAYTYDVKQERDGYYGALAITTQSAGTITAIDTTAALGTCSFMACFFNNFIESIDVLCHHDAYC